VACSGGPDSIALAHWTGYHYTSQQNKNRRLQALIFIDHQTPASTAGKQCVYDLAKKLDVPIGEHILPPKQHCPKKASLEEWWHHHRRNIYRSYDMAILTGHHLDDAVETALMGYYYGNNRILALKSGNIYRPLILCKKSQLLNYCQTHRLGFVQDQSNDDIKFLRNATRTMLYNSSKQITDLLYAKEKKRINNSLLTFHKTN
tara:strand:+ start:2704 stop:3312 length:609 start_codon:yes stop_codon:yes gene_type:complete